MSESTRSRAPVKPLHPNTPGRPRPRSEVTDVDCSRAVKGTGALYFLNVWQGTRYSTYWLLPLVCPDGIAFQFQVGYREKPPQGMQADTYDVAIFFDGETCTCPGFGRFSRCKHLAALRTLVERGQFAPDPDDLGEPCGQCFPDEPGPSESFAGAGYKPGPNSDLPF